MNKQLQQVGEFHRAFSIPRLESPAIPSSDRVSLRIKLQKEELQELVDAVVPFAEPKTDEDKLNQLVEATDAIIDQAYILFGTVHEFGLADIFEELFDEVQRSNMSKLDENGKPIYREDGKVLKSSLFTKPDLKAIILKHLQK